MEKLDLTRPRRIIWILIAALSIITGCQTRPHLTVLDVTEAGWRVQTGQAIWKQGPHAAEIAGELLLAQQDNGRAFMQFTKTPFPVVTAQITATNWVMSFPGVRREYSGGGKRPERLAWLYLPEAMAGKSLPKAFHFVKNHGGNWLLENTRTGERLEGYLAP
jgi:hypothetical protein